MPSRSIAKRTSARRLARQSRAWAWCLPWLLVVVGPGGRVAQGRERGDSSLPSLHQGLAGRNTPTPVGTTRTVSCRASRWSDHPHPHPHADGEGRYASTLRRVGAGTPPRWWGGRGAVGGADGGQHAPRRRGGVPLSAGYYYPITRTSPRPRSVDVMQGGSVAEFRFNFDNSVAHHRDPTIYRPRFVSFTLTAKSLREARSKVTYETQPKQPLTPCREQQRPVAGVFTNPCP